MQQEVPMALVVKAYQGGWTTDPTDVWLRARCRFRALNTLRSERVNARPSGQWSRRPRFRSPRHQACCLHMISYAVCLTVVSLLLFGCQVSLAQVYSDREPIAFIGHGALFGPDGSEIAPTGKFLVDATRWYADELSKGLNETQKTEFQRLSTDVSGIYYRDEQSQAYANAQLVDWLLDRTERADVNELRSKNNLIKKVLSQRLTGSIDVRFPSGIGEYQPDPNLLAKFLSFKTDVHPFAFTPSGGATYRDECRKAGVPIPPDFGPGSGWVSQGVIPKSDLFIVRGDDAEVLTWTSVMPAGMCIALPRYSADKKVQADGVICFGKVSSKVCFWDNQVRDGQGDAATFEFPLGSTQPFDRWGGGTDLRGAVGGICSDCHAGENPYVIHGKILGSLSDTLPTFPDQWYDPLVRNGDKSPWPENPGPMDSPGPCNGCHGSAASPSHAGRLPALSSKLPGYCGAVLRSSLGALAPPLKGSTNPPASMPQGRNAGTYACTPGLGSADPRYRPCSVKTIIDCTPEFSSVDPRRNDADFPNAYKVSCTQEMADLLMRCKLP
jgi:hypothetical protein